MFCRKRMPVRSTLKDFIISVSGAPVRRPRNGYYEILQGRSDRHSLAAEHCAGKSSHTPPSAELSKRSGQEVPCAAAQPLCGRRAAFDRRHQMPSELASSLAGAFLDIGKDAIKRLIAR